MISRRHHKHKLVRDIVIIFFSIILAIFIVKTDFFRNILIQSENAEILGSFISGIFFTSVFTTSLSIVAFGELSLQFPILKVALIGALGGVCGDLILFLFLKRTMAEDIQYILQSSKKYKKFYYIFRLRIFRWLTPVLGALIIASPLPDELGLAMMGLTALNIRYLIPISFIMNFIGIAIIGLIANSLI